MYYVIIPYDGKAEPTIYHNRAPRVNYNEPYPPRVRSFNYEIDARRYIRETNPSGYRSALRFIGNICPLKVSHS